MNKNGDSATMYGTIPAVAGLNRVEGFDPSSLLSCTVSTANGEEGLQLNLVCKKLWFRLAYPKGRLQTERISITEQMAVFEARVYLDCSDTNPVSSSVSGCTREDAPGGRYIQAAQDEAMDRALTDAGFGLQFADMHADGSTAGIGERPEHSGTGAAATAKGDARNIQNAGSEAATENTGTVGSVVPAGNTGHAGNVVRTFPGASADGGTKKVPAQGTQPSGSRQPAQAVAVPQGQPAVAGTGQSVHTDTMPQSQGGKPTGTRQPVQAAGTSQGQGGQPVGAGQPAHAAVPQGQPVPMGTRQPVHTGTISQGQGGQPAETRQPVRAAIMPQRQTQPAQSAGARQPVPPAVFQGKTSPAAGTGKPTPASAPQGQRVQPIGGSQGAMSVMPQKQEMQPAGGGLSAQAVIPQGQGVMPAGNKQPVTPAMAQKQPVGNGQSAQTTMPQDQGVMPAGNKQPVTSTMPQKQAVQPLGTKPAAQEVKPVRDRQPLQATMPQGQGMQPGGDGSLTQLAAVTSAAAGKAAFGGARLGEVVKNSTESGGQAAAQNRALKEQGKSNPSAGVTGDARLAKGQRYFGNTGAASAAPQNQPPHDSMTARSAQPAVPQDMPGQLPVPPASVEGRGAAQPDSEGAASAMDSLPVPPMGRTGQMPAEAASATEDALPVPADVPEKRNTRSSVQEAMALLKGNVLPADTAAGTTEGGGDNTAGNVIGNMEAKSAEAIFQGNRLPENGETAQGGPAPRYTPDMPVEEIVSLMTLEEAGKVVVDTGVSKGQTVAEVAERRPPSLKYYRYGGYKGPNNILRAAAQVMLDSMEGQKAG